jgi:hypothetical protein
MGTRHALEITLRLCIDAEDAEAGVLAVARAAAAVGAEGPEPGSGIEVAWTRLRPDGSPEVSEDEDLDALAIALAIAGGDGGSTCGDD